MENPPEPMVRVAQDDGCSFFLPFVVLGPIRFSHLIALGNHSHLTRVIAFQYMDLELWAAGTAVHLRLQTQPHTFLLWRQLRDLHISFS